MRPFIKKILLCTLMFIGVSAFSDKYAWAEITINQENVIETGKLGDNVTYTLSDEGIVVVSGTGDMYDGVSPFAYNDCVKEIYIQDGVTSIGSSVFSDIHYLEKVEIGNNVTSIGSLAFVACYRLTSIVIPASVNCIECGAFVDCEELQELRIPSSVTTIERWAIPEYIPKLVFDNVVLSEPYIFEPYTMDDERSYMYDEEYNIVTSLDANKIINGTYTKEITNYGDISHAGYCGDIYWEIDKSGTLTLSGEGDFKLRNLGKFISDKDGNEIFDAYIKAFWLKYQSEIKNAKISVKGVTTLNGVLGQCICENLETVDFSGSELNKVISCSESFRGAEKLRSVKMNDIEFSSLASTRDMFWDCESLVNVEMNNTSMPNVVSITRMFMGCSSLETVSLSDTSMTCVSELEGLFDGCSSLKKVDLSGICIKDNAFASGAFFYCGVLEELRTPYSTGILDTKFVHPMKDGQIEYSGLPQNMNSSITLRWDGTHTWYGHNVIKSATCCAAGIYEQWCEYCMERQEVAIPICPNNHAGGTEVRGEKEATCIEEGYTGDIYCKGCGEKIVTGEEISKKEHNWDGEVEYFTPSEARIIYECIECGEMQDIRNEKASTLARANDGNWYDYIQGQKSSYTGLRFYNGSWWYVKGGKVDFGATTLCKYNGSWWYVEKGKVNFSATTLCLYNGSWWYVEKGKVNFSATTLCKYNGSWWYVEKGKVNFNATTLCNYGGTWWYVQKGKVNFGATTLCNYGGSWWYVEKGKVNFSATTICKYNGSWWYVEKGKVNFNATTLCNYGGTWWYVQKGKVNFGATTLCKYNGTWWYVEKGAVNFNYTGYFKYYGTNYRIVKGVVKF